jgi:hypothetical protein
MVEFYHDIAGCCDRFGVYQHRYPLMIDKDNIMVGVLENEHRSCRL